MDTVSRLAIVIVVINIVLIAVLIFKPGIAAARKGKLLAFVAFCLMPLVAGSIGAANHFERSKTTEFCLNCHVMKDYGQSLLADDRAFIPAVHYQNHLVPAQQACFTCHTNYTMFGGINAKLRGFRHVYVQYFGSIPEPQNVKLYEAYNNRDCLHCHEGARSFEEGATHNQEAGRLAAIKANRTSCLTSGCHDSVHNVDQLKSLTLWKGVEK